MDRYKVDLFKEDRQPVLAAFKAVSPDVKLQANSINLLRLQNVISLAKRIPGVDGDVVNVLGLLKLTNPPLVADPAGAVANPRVAPRIAPMDRMPSTIPTVLLTEAEKRESYGIPFKKLPKSAKNALDAYNDWCTKSINLDRGREYASPVQHSSMVKTLEVMRAFMGYCVNKQRVNIKDVDLHLYADIHKFANFMGYLVARGACHGQQTKQIAVAKKVSQTRYLKVSGWLLSKLLCSCDVKVNYYLRTGSGSRYPALREAAGAVDTWFSNLQAQLSASAPAPEVAALPEHHDVHVWAKSLANDTLRQVAAEMETLGCLTCDTAFLVRIGLCL